MEYEVRCYDCDVSYPVGTKRCLYCGARTGSAGRAPSILSIEQLLDSSQPGQSEVQSGPREVLEEETPRQAGMFSRLLGGMSWVLLFAAISIYRACSG